MLTTIILIYLLKEVTPDINLAYYRNVKYCGNKLLSFLMVDQDKDVNNAERLYSPCDEYSYVQIVLGEVYLVHYVIVYEGTFNSSTGVLDHFRVDIIDKYARNYLCGIYPKTSIGPIFNKGMRVNCRVRNATIVNIISKRNIGFSIAEVEVYTMSILKPNEGVSIYYGCFRILTHSNLKLSFEWKKCLDNCRSQDYAFIALQGNDTCYCTYKSDVHIIAPRISCYKICVDHFCGGDGNVFSVYLANVQLPHYIGCYVDIPDILFRSSNAGENCFHTCSDYMYIGLKLRQYCYCINVSFDGLQKSEDKLCNQTCASIDTMMCGGIGFISVYSMKMEQHTVKTMQLMKCYSEFDIYGICKLGCQAGYIGDQCLQAEVRFCEDIHPCANISNTVCETVASNFQCTCIPGFVRFNLLGDCHAGGGFCVDFDPCVNIPNTVCEAVPSNFRCTCKPGFARFDPFGACDVETYCTLFKPCSHIVNSECVVANNNHECKCIEDYAMLDNTCVRISKCEDVNPCINITNSKCIRLRNVYKCPCNEGYFENDTLGTCEDIDECEINPCDSKTSTCANLNGSFYCECKPNFVQVTSLVCIRKDIDEFDLPSADYHKFIFYVIAFGSFLCTVFSFFIVGLKLKHTPSQTASTHVSTLTA